MMEPDDEPERREPTISENSLRKLCRSLTTFFPKNRTQVDAATLTYLRSLHDDLLGTASSTKLSIAHNTAALNGLCSFLELCCASPVPELHALPLTFESWTLAFHIFLTRSENNKTKPLKRLLSTLTQVILKHPSVEVKSALIGYAILRATRTIRKQDDLVSVKAAIQTLEQFLSKRIVDAFEIVQSGETKKLTYSRQGLTAPNVSATVLHDAVKNFTLDILEWVQYPDCAPAAGRFLATFYGSLHKLQSDQKAAHSFQNESLPRWILPVKQSLDKHQSLLNVYENYILLELLRLGNTDREAFLSTLPFDEIQNGNAGNHTVVDIQLCFLVARIDLSSNISMFPGASQDRNHEAKDHKKTEPAQAQPGILTRINKCINIDAVRLGVNLLDHASSVVRIAALSLLISYPAPTYRFSKEVLQALRYCLPFFHIEADAKTRNDFISLLKKLCARLKSVILSLTRENHDESQENPELGLSASQSKHVLEKHRKTGDMGITEEHLAFRSWYLPFLINELRPTSSYQSHITALKVLRPLLEGEAPIRATVLRYNIHNITGPEVPSNDSLLRPLLDLLIDPFDDVREAANTLLELYFPSMKLPVSHRANELDADHHNESNEILVTLHAAEAKAAETGRADHADGVGRLYNLLYGRNRCPATSSEWHNSASLILEHLIFKLEKEVQLAKKDLPRAVSVAPLHGHLIALRHIFSRSDCWVLFNASSVSAEGEWIKFNERILSICNNVWEAVRAVLCLDAPEGTTIVDEEADDPNISTKDTLSYCWRALKDSSLLMHAMVVNSSHDPSQSLQGQNSHRLGRLSLIQLGELRHRGAFSTVSITFASCCAACRHSGVSELFEEPRMWYQEALACIAQNASAFTRRSAGLPAMITGILAACTTGPFFDDVILDLQAIANAPVNDAQDADDARLPQVHALNCLKDIFTDARFANGTERHMAVTLDIAASCLKSYIWAIRNCGLMLFKALVRRLNGGTDTSSTKVSSSHRRSSHLAYQTYSTLPELVLRLLSDGDQTQPGTFDSNVRKSGIISTTVNTQKVFAALEVIERFGIPAKYNIDVRAAIWRYAQSSDWSIREKAAKTLSLVIEDQDLEGECTSLLLPQWKSQNELHGRLLCLRFMLDQASVPQVGEMLGVYERLPQAMDISLKNMFASNPCPITVAAFIDCMTGLCKVLIQYRSPMVISLYYMMNQCLISHSSKEAGFLSKNVASPLLTRAMARLSMLMTYVESHQAQHGNHGHDGLRYSLYHPFSEHDIRAIIILDETVQFTSDENVLAAFRHTSTHELEQASSRLCSADRSTHDSTERPQLENVQLVSSPLEADLALALHAYPLGAAYAGCSENEGRERLLARWIRMLRVAGAESTEFRRRSAAAFSLRGFFDGLLDNHWRSFSDPKMIDGYIALYDTLVDDDEDIRDQGAATVSLLLSAFQTNRSVKHVSNRSLSPPAAKRRLLQYLNEAYRTSRTLCHRALEKLTDSQLSSSGDAVSRSRDDEGEIKLRPVAEILAYAHKPQLAVFVEEKQNLYIDSVEEAEVWAKVLVGLDPDAWNAKLAAPLETWTMEGLLHLIQTCKENKDAPLGLTSKPGIYTLFIRVILSAEILSSRTEVPLTEGHMSGDVFIALLRELLELGRRARLHDLLIRRLGTMLGEA